MILSVDSLVGGEILDEPIQTESNEILIPKNTIIKKEYIPLIQSMEIKEVIVKNQNKFFKTIIPQHRIDFFENKIQLRMQNHIYQNDQSLREFEVIASEIVKEIELLDEDVKFSLFERKANLYEHTLMVTLYSVIVAKKMKITKRDELNNIALGCILHDIGLRYITTNYKNRNLEEVSSYEQFEYKKHTIMGYSAIEQENWIPKISKKIILYHHEQQDGKGFPMRQKNKEREVQIIQVCDMVDRNLCGIECNRISVSEVLKKLKEKSGFIYNNDVVENFVSMIIHESVV